MCRHCQRRNEATDRFCTNCEIGRVTKRTSLKTRADTKARELCRRESAEKCARCGGLGSDWAHRWPRRFHNVRWSRDNCDFLCRPCHRFFTTHPAAFLQWLIARGVDVEGLERRANEQWDGDYPAVFAKLAQWEGSL